MQSLDFNGLTMCLSKATLAAGTTTTFSTTNATGYAINGKIYSTAAAANAATPTLDGNTGKAFVAVAPNKGSVFVFAYDGQAAAANAIKVYQGTIEDLDSDANFVKPPQMPQTPDTVCPFAYMVLKAGSTASNWTFGVSNQSGATGITYLRQDVANLPTRPQVA